MNLNFLKLICAKTSLSKSSDRLEKRGDSARGGIQCLKSMVLSLLFVAIASVGFAQSGAVSGVVNDSDGYPLIGANVVIEGTTVGTVTDLNGEYTLPSVASGATLIFSSLGFESQVVAVGARTKIDVTLSTNSEVIEELVVVGFGVQKKETLTGSIVQVSGEEVISNKGTTNALVAMQGEMPGVTITRTSSRPDNEGADIKIRGNISSNGVSPLILLDGVEISEAQLGQVNSLDIESYSVLKDGSAAIFGTKAAGGVILVTTKKGQAGKARIDVSLELQLNIPYELPICNLQEYAILSLEGGANSSTTYVDANGDTQTSSEVYSGNFSKEIFQAWAAGEFADVIQYQGTTDYLVGNPNYYDEMYGVTLSQIYTASVSGGNERVTYRTSLGYSNERSTLNCAYDGAKKYNFRTNVSYKISDVLTTDFRVSFDNKTSDVPTQGVGSGLQDPWAFALYNDDGSYYSVWNTYNRNPVEKIVDGGRTVTSYNTTTLGGTFKADLDKYVTGLSLQYVGNVNIYNTEKMAQTAKLTTYSQINGLTYETGDTSTSVVNTLTNTLFQNHTVQGNWVRSFGDHNVGVMLGMTSELKDYQYYYLKRTTLADNSLIQLNTLDTTTDTLSGYSTVQGLVSYIGRLNYDYRGIYIAEGSIRRDGSSCLSAENRWSNFYYGSAGIRLSELDAFKGGFFDNLKVFASYGETGSTTGISAYDAYATISTGSRYFGLDSISEVNTAYLSAMTTDDRTWERVAKSNIGVDFAILDNRLTGIAEFYYNTNNDMLTSITYPDVLGATAPKTNSGQFMAKGWEVSFNWRDRINKDFSYSVGISAWDSYSEVVSMEGANSISAGANSTIEGYPLNSYFMYQTSGLFQTEAEVLDYYEAYGFSDDTQLNYKTGTLLSSYAYRSSTKLTAGCVRRDDVNGDGILSTDDLVFVGDTDAHYCFSLNIGLTYKNWDFTAFFQGVGTQYIYRTSYLAYPFISSWTNLNSSYIGKTWNAETNPDSDYPILYGAGDSRNAWNYRLNDINLNKSTYVRAKTLSLAYNIPNAVTAKLGVENARFSVAGNDLFCISNVTDGLDPENQAAASTLFPFTASVIFNLQFSL